MRRNDNLMLLGGIMMLLIGAQQMLIHPAERVRNYAALLLGVVMLIYFLWTKRKRNRTDDH